MTSSTRTTWWLIEGHETEHGTADIVVMARTWARGDERVDTPEQVFMRMDEVPVRSHEDGRFGEYAQSVLRAMDNQTLAELRVAGQAVEISAATDSRDDPPA
jgi:hypothetical protein